MLENELELLLAEAAINGMDKNDFLSMCNEIYSKIKVSGDSEPKTIINTKVKAFR